MNAKPPVTASPTATLLKRDRARRQQMARRPQRQHVLHVGTAPDQAGEAEQAKPAAPKASANSISAIGPTRSSVTYVSER